MQPEEMQFSYNVLASRMLNADFFAEYGINPASFHIMSDGSYVVFATDLVIERLKDSPLITTVRKQVMSPRGEDRIFPDGMRMGWNRDQYGPLTIP